MSRIYSSLCNINYMNNRIDYSLIDATSREGLVATCSSSRRRRRRENENLATHEAGQTDGERERESASRRKVKRHLEGKRNRFRALGME